MTASFGLHVGLNGLERRGVSRVHQHEFAVFQRGDCHRGFLRDGDAVAAVGAHAVNLDGAGRRNEIAETRRIESVFGGLAGFQRGGQHAGVGADRQRIIVGGKTAGDGDELAGAVGLGKRLRAPGRLPALLRRHDPDLEDLGRDRLQIVFGVADAGPRAHHLHVAGFGASLVAERVLMGDGTFAHIGDDLHVGMGMRRKAGVRRDLVVVPDP
jgi:hypothetical protein